MKKRFDNEKKMIAGVGSALIDILAHENDDFLAKIDAVKGGMTLVDKNFIEHALSLITCRPQVVPGGSACNTVVGVGRLGGQARFVGKCGQGPMGTLFENELKKNNVDPVLFKSSSPTGKVLSIITPDAQRSMLTFLGAASETHPEEITEKCFENTAIVHVEGYLVFNEALILAALRAAQKAGARISLDLSSFTIVESSKTLLKTIVKEYVDILIANEDEARAYTGWADETRAIRALAEDSHFAALKIGKHGSYIAHSGNIIKIDPKGTGTAVDTTGAGDLWAAGFLFGLVNDYSLEKCGELGSACGYEVCQVDGANIPEQGWHRIKKLLEE